TGPRSSCCGGWPTVPKAARRLRSADEIGELTLHLGEAAVDDVDRLLDLALGDHQRGRQMQDVPHPGDQPSLLSAEGQALDEGMLGAPGLSGLLVAHQVDRAQEPEPAADVTDGG